MTSLDEVPGARDERPRESAPPARRLGSTAERWLLAGLYAACRRSRLDEPHLRSMAARRGRRLAALGGQVVSLLRQLENGAERSRRRAKPVPDATALWSELGLAAELAASGELPEGVTWAGDARLSAPGRAGPAPA